jgi:hypothetical protein
MSRPQNPLDQYQSYAYHHILVVSNNTESIRKLVSTNANGQQNFLAGVSGATLGQEIGEGVYLLTDTRKTSEFQIDSLSYNVLISDDTSPVNSVIIGGLVNIRLIDPSGIGFFNYMHYLINEKLETDVSGLTFLLHTTFMGHTPSGTVPIDSISIPLTMTAEFNLSEFNARGGIYDIGFVCTNFGSGTFLDNVSILPESFHLVCKDGLLGNAIQSFENQLNLKSKEWYLKYNPQYIKSDGSVANDTSTGTVKNEEPPKIGRMVQYMFTIPDNWFYYYVDTQAENTLETDWKKLKQEKAQAQNNQTPEQKTIKPEDIKHNTQIVTSVNMTIMDALNVICRNTPEINQLMSLENKKSGNGKIFKILTSVTSNADTILVHYDFVEFDLPDVNMVNKIQDKSNEKSSNLPTRENQVVPDNSIEFDYIFSGKNSDIINMDIKANNLTVALMTRSSIAQQAKESKLDAGQKKPEDVNKVSDKIDFNEIGKYQPIIRPPRTTEESTNFASTVNKRIPLSEKRMEDRQHFQHALADLNVVSIQPDIKIRGNPALLSRYTLEKIPPHIMLAGSVKDFIKTTEDEKKYNETQGAWEYNISSKSKPASKGSTIVDNHIEHRKFIEENFVTKIQNEINQDVQEANNPKKSFISGGTWAKVNIFAPSDYPFAIDAGSEFKTQFFYDSWYMVKEISNHFEGGSFTQDLKLMSYDLYGNHGTKKTS